MRNTNDITPCANSTARSSKLTVTSSSPSSNVGSSVAAFFVMMNAPGSFATLSALRMST